MSYDLKELGLILECLMTIRIRMDKYIKSTGGELKDLPLSRIKEIEDMDKMITKTTDLIEKYNQKKGVSDEHNSI